MSLTKFYFNLGIFLILYSGLSSQRVNNDLISDFYQTTVIVDPAFENCSRDHKLGNCVSIALIKGALGQFGTLENVFRSISYNPDSSFNIVFNDNDSIILFKNEIDIATQLAGIKGDTESSNFRNAMILYASICKRILKYKSDYSRCIHSFVNAVEYLNSGYSTPNSPQLLGFKSQQVDISNLVNQPVVIVWCSAHAAVCSFGMQDLTGKAVPLKRNKMRNLRRYSRIKDAIILVK